MGIFERDVNAALREEARESWEHFISDEVVYVAQLKGAKSTVAPHMWVR